MNDASVLAISAVAAVIGVVILYVVIRFAVLHAMKAHSVWATSENVGAGREKLAARAAREESARKQMWAYQGRERTPPSS